MNNDQEEEDDYKYQQPMSAEGVAVFTYLVFGGLITVVICILHFLTK